MSFPEKLNLKYGELVRLKNTGTELDGEVFEVAGLASRNVLDSYIIRFGNNYTTARMPDFGEYDSLVMWEACLERI